MYLGQNYASHAIHYLNSQLKASWENSVECLQHTGRHLKALERVRYDFALAEFHVGAKQRLRSQGKHETAFSAIFDVPKLHFICNHEAVLYLKMKKGHVKVEHIVSKSSSLPGHRTKDILINDLEVALRLSFNIHTIQGHATHICHGSYHIPLLVLDFSSARIVSRVIPEDAREPLSFYLKKYLAFLQHVGYHVLFSLPDFHASHLDIEIDYSMESHQIRNVSTKENSITSRHFSSDQINEHLSSKWLKAVLDKNNGADFKSTCLAEYNSRTSNFCDNLDMQFHAKFSVPKVEILCKREVIIYLTITELSIYNNRHTHSNPKSTHHNWKIAIVANLTKEVDIDTTRIEIDMSSIRFCDRLSIFKGLDMTTEISFIIKNAFIEFINHYVTVLEISDFHHLYDAHQHSETFEEYSDSDDDTETESWKEIEHPHTHFHKFEELVKHAHIYEFDFVQVISQEALIEHFKSLWHHSRETKQDDLQCLHHWTHEKVFKAIFSAITLKIIGNGKVIVWINMEEVTVTLLDGITVAKASDWNVAFEVSFTMIDHEELASTCKSWSKRFTNSLAWKHHGNHKDRFLRHLCLDFTNVKFIYELSRFNGLSLGNDVAVGQLNAVVHYLTSHYFPHLRHHGHHVLYSLPVWKADSSPPPFGLTQVTYQIYTKNIIKTPNYRRLLQTEVDIAIIGMTKFKPMPSRPLPYSTNLLVKTRGSTPYGTVIISRKRFINDCLLTLLSQINAATTIVPIFPGGIDDRECVPMFTMLGGREWDIALTTWGRRYYQLNNSSRWEEKPNSSGEYTWSHSDNWNYEHQGGHNDKSNGVYTVDCRTNNHLQVPGSDLRSGRISIVIHGQTVLKISFKGVAGIWSVEFIAKWSITLSINSDSSNGGIAIDVKGNTRPKFETKHGRNERSPSGLVNINTLQALLNVDLVNTVSELRNLFGGVWNNCFPSTGALSLCNPALSYDGDIIFGLQPHGFSSQSSPSLLRPHRGHAAPYDGEIFLASNRPFDDIDDIDEHSLGRSPTNTHRPGSHNSSGRRPSHSDRNHSDPVYSTRRALPTYLPQSDHSPTISLTHLPPSRPPLHHRPSYHTLSHHSPSPSSPQHHTPSHHSRSYHSSRHPSPHNTPSLPPRSPPYHSPPPHSPSPLPSSPPHQSLSHHSPSHHSSPHTPSPHHPPFEQDPSRYSPPLHPLSTSHHSPSPPMSSPYHSPSHHSSLHNSPQHHPPFEQIPSHHSPPPHTPSHHSPPHHTPPPPSLPPHHSPPHHSSSHHSPSHHSSHHSSLHSSPQHHPPSKQIPSRHSPPPHPLSHHSASDHPLSNGSPYHSPRYDHVPLSPSRNSPSQHSPSQHSPSQHSTSGHPTFNRSPSQHSNLHPDDPFPPNRPSRHSPSNHSTPHQTPPQHHHSPSLLHQSPSRQSSPHRPPSIRTTSHHSPQHHITPRQLPSNHSTPNRTPSQHSISKHSSRAHSPRPHSPLHQTPSQHSVSNHSPIHQSSPRHPVSNHSPPPHLFRSRSFSPNSFAVRSPSMLSSPIASPLIMQPHATSHDGVPLPSHPRMLRDNVSQEAHQSPEVI